MEQWRAVIGFEGLYEISSLGRVHSLRPRNESQRTLNEKQIEQIRKLSADGVSSRNIARSVGVSQPIISKILRGTAYKTQTHILRPAVRGDGYLFVTLAVNRKHWHKTIHSMVAAAFIGPRPPGRHINHKNGDKLDNRASNLEYVSPAGNAQHALYETQRKTAKLTLEKATDIWYAKQRGERRKDVAAKHGCSIHMISAIWMGKSWWHAR